MDQAVDAVEVDERAEVDDVRDLAFDDEPRLQAVEDLLADLLALLLEDRAAREHDVVARAVELDHLRLDLRAHVLVEVRHAADVDERRRQEAAHAEVDDQAALDDLDDGALDRLAGLGRRFDAPPRLLEARALLRHDQAAVLVLLGEDDRVDLLAERDLVVRVDRLADRQLVRGDDALGLVADVDEDLVLVDPDDVARDDLPLLERAEWSRRSWGRSAPSISSRSPFEPSTTWLGVLDHRLHRRSVAQHRHRPRTCIIGGDACTRAPPRGAARTPLERDCDVLVCGASFAGLTLARELEGAGARVLMVDRYEIGERQTSACAVPTRWLSAMACRTRIRQTFPDLVVHTPWRTARWPLPWSFSTFDYRELCALLVEPGRRRRARVRDRDRRGPRRRRPCTPTAASCARRSSSTRSAGGACSRSGTPIQPPDARLSRGLEVHPHGARRGDGAVDRPRATCAPATLELPGRASELRVGFGSF